MAFYEEISKYYDYIFPVGTEQLDFIKSMAGEPPRRILDVACGSGGYSLALVEDGYHVTGTDIDSSMVKKARSKAMDANLTLEILHSDMLELKDRLQPEFDQVFCIGNSIVHLGTPEQIGYALEGFGSLLKRDGFLVLQIINFDRILKYGINQLPTIVEESVGLRFERNYVMDDSTGLIDFNTILAVNGDEGAERYENSIKLLPLLKDDLVQLLEKAGFTGIELYGDFKGSAYQEDSFMLVAKAKKG